MQMSVIKNLRVAGDIYITLAFLVLIFIALPWVTSVPDCHVVVLLLDPPPPPPPRARARERAVCLPCCFRGHR